MRSFRYRWLAAVWGGFLSFCCCLVVFSEAVAVPVPVDNLTARVDYPIVETRQLVRQWATHNDYSLQEISLPATKCRFFLSRGRTEIVIVLVSNSPLATTLTLENGPETYSARSEIFSSIVTFVKHRPKAEENAGEISGDPLPGPSLLDKYARRIVCLLIHQEDGDIQSSGICLEKPRGVILTTAHEISRVSGVEVRLGETVRAGELVCLDRDRDLALVRVQGVTAHYEQLRMRDAVLAPGEEIFFLGYPLGKEMVMRRGSVERPRKMNGRVLWQVNLDIEPGSSGSPVFDAREDLAGIVKGRLRGAENKGFIIPLDTVRSFLENYMEKKHSGRFGMPYFNGGFD